MYKNLWSEEKLVNLAPLHKSTNRVRDRSRCSRSSTIDRRRAFLGACVHKPRPTWAVSDQSAQPPMSYQRRLDCWRVALGDRPLTRGSKVVDRGAKRAWAGADLGVRVNMFYVWMCTYYVAFGEGRKLFHVHVYLESGRSIILLGMRSCWGKFELQLLKQALYSSSWKLQYMCFSEVLMLRPSA